MLLITRRATLAVGATLTAAIAPRKPGAQTILSPKAELEVRLLGIDKLVPTEPPAAPPALGFTDVAGLPVGLGDFAGQGVVLNLWATWCVPCVAEMPALDALAAQLGPDNITVVPLSSDRGGAAVVRKFYAARAIQHLGIWLDPHGVTARALGARGLPTTLIIDRQGHERGRLEGGAEWASAEAVAMIRKLVS
jgi:thiol-disulfide isomerase/thioredoxin